MTELDKSKEITNTPSKSRRSFLIKSAMVPPVISTVASKPVWGTGICALSGSLSGNMSNHGDQYDCEGPKGRSPGYWCQWIKATFCPPKKLGFKILYNWSEAGAWPTTSFSLIFGSAPSSGAPDSLGGVMMLGDYNQGSTPFERHVVAAYLSSKHSLMASEVPYTTTQVIDAYQKVMANPGTQQASDIIDIFDALFTNHIDGSVYDTQISVTADDMKALKLITNEADCAQDKNADCNDPSAHPGQAHTDAH
ncbi:hypothetical protein [Colwellia sp. MEBiC06753]